MTSTVAEISLVIIAIMLTVIALSHAIAAFAALRGWKRIDRIGDELENTANKVGQFGPKVDRILEELSGEIRDVRVLTRRTDAVAADVQTLSSELRRGVEMLNVTRRTHAAVAGVRAGLTALVRPSGANGKGDNNV